MISHKHKAILFHILKCAVTTNNHILDYTIGFNDLYWSKLEESYLEETLHYKYYLHTARRAFNLYGLGNAMKVVVRHLTYLGSSTVTAIDRTRRNSVPSI